MMKTTMMDAVTLYPTCDSMDVFLDLSSYSNITRGIYNEGNAGVDKRVHLLKIQCTVATKSAEAE